MVSNGKTIGFTSLLLILIFRAKDEATFLWDIATETIKEINVNQFAIIKKNKKEVVCPFPRKSIRLLKLPNKKSN